MTTQMSEAECREHLTKLWIAAQKVRQELFGFLRDSKRPTMGQIEGLALTLYAAEEPLLRKVKANDQTPRTIHS